MSWLEHKYIGILSSRLERFKRKGPNLFNFRCPLCGDSQDNKVKARGYIYERKGELQFHCHNCSRTLSVQNFIKELDHNLYNEYRLETYRDTKRGEQDDLIELSKDMERPKFPANPLSSLRKVSQLEEDDQVLKLVKSRQIPASYYSKLYSCPNFMAFSNALHPDKFSKEALRYDETRLTIPFFNKEGVVHAYTGRSLSGDGVRYILIVLDYDAPVVYGLDIVDLSKTTYVFEGPIDSMFIHNSLATAGGDLVASVCGLDKTNMVLVYDNEPRSKTTFRKLEKAINNGFAVCIWPREIEQKDVNDMVLAGMTSDLITHIISKNTYRGLTAKMALSDRSRV